MSSKKVTQQLWSKGDLLDSLDLSTTNLATFSKKQQGEQVPENSLAQENWLEADIRASIQEWAPRLKPSKFVDKIKSIKENTSDFLVNELICVTEEEKTLQNSLGKLNLRAHRNTKKLEIIQLEEEAEKLQESIARLRPQPDLTLQDSLELDAHTVQPQPLEESEFDICSQRTCMSRKDIRTIASKHKAAAPRPPAAHGIVYVNPDIDLHSLFD